MVRQKIIKIANYAMVSGILLFVLIFFKAWIDGKFVSVESFQQYVNGYGVFAPIILTLFQAVQVVLPVLPGFLGCAAGSLMFGTTPGFLCNYIGISAGSIIAFILARKYGKALVEEIFMKSTKYEKWERKTEDSRSFEIFIFMATLVPLFPDDYLCYISGLTKMTLRKFVWIIILGKPWCILAYSIGFSLLG